MNLPTLSISSFIIKEGCKALHRRSGLQGLDDNMFIIKTGSTIIKVELMIIFQVTLKPKNPVILKHFLNE